MASANMIARFESKLESELRALRESQNAMLDVQNAKYSVLIWLAGGWVLLLLTLFGHLLTQS